jgi:putative two-component system response regulator
MQDKRYKIMLVDDDMSQLIIGKNMLINHFEVFAIPSAPRLFEVLKNVEADLILLDIVMPGMDGYETITRLKSDDNFADIPVIFITAQNDETSEFKGLDLGAIDYITKPFSAPLLVKRIQNHLRLASHEKELKNYNTNLERMVQEKTRQVVTLQNSLISSLAEMVEIRDSVTGSHVIRTQKYLELLVEQSMKDSVYLDEIAKWDLETLCASAQLHDVGKIAISDAILNKPGKLTEEEFTQMKRHVPAGVDALSRIEKTASAHSFLFHAQIFAGTHHEKWDGTGYPAGLRGCEIPLQGRLMAIADVYDALISERLYKPAYSQEKSVSIMVEGKGKHFDPALVGTFLKVADRFAEIAHEYR